MITLSISIKGIVQGVGFRPFVYSLAYKHALTGKVWNTSAGVEIIITGAKKSIDEFLQEIKADLPPLAQIDNIETKQVDFRSFHNFRIIESQQVADSFIPISPDISICEDCKRELFDPGNRRFRYPFINCTNCGPRLTIIKDIPYDRPNTTMAEFQLCDECQTEYQNPLDRRFHAQPVACSKCGPQLSFHSLKSPDLKREEALQTARLFIKENKIIAVKGLGGYHIVCSAMNKNTINTLINRKRRSEKPLALMAFDLETINKYCEVSSEEAKLLESVEHPIVLLKKKLNTNLPENIATNQNTLGFMLPYTPLHLLLLEPEINFPEVLVMTSGNLSEEPIAFTDQDAKDRLAFMVDGFLTHNREINIRVDDSVARIFNTKPYLIRRSRGYAPKPIKLPFASPEILACGAELKNTYCLSRSDYAFLSHHIGDLENNETLESFESGIEYYKRLFRVSPIHIAADLHPNYLSSKYAIDYSNRENISLTQVQHHHAHLASCLADNGWDSEDAAIGVIFDGTGYGIDGTIWGGEFLIGSYEGFSRQKHLMPTPLPGGDSATKTPAKIGLTYLHQAGINLDDDLPSVDYFTKAQRTTLISQIESRINTPMTSSMGRLFDAVSSIIGVRQEVTYEAQAAIELENIYAPNVEEMYEIETNVETINFLPMIRSIVDDVHSGLNKRIISAKFHNAIAYMSLQSCRQIRLSTGISQVALSGGVWQNMTLLRKTYALLLEDGFKVMTHHQVPANDGGVSLGQLLIAAKFLSIRG